MAIFLVSTLNRVHQRGWLHADLQPKDLSLHQRCGKVVVLDICICIDRV